MAWALGLLLSNRLTNCRYKVTLAPRDQEEFVTIVWGNPQHSCPGAAGKKASKSDAHVVNQVIRNRYPRALKMYGLEISHTRILEIRARLLISASRCWYSGPPKNYWTVGPQEGAAAFPWEGFYPGGGQNSRAPSIPAATTGRHHCPAKGTGRLPMAFPSPPLLFTYFPEEVRRVLARAAHTRCSLRPGRRQRPAGLPKR